MAHVHSIVDADPHFSVDLVERTIKKNSQKQVKVRLGDHNSERVTFELKQRTVEGHDMSTCNLVEVHYNNGGNRGVYQVEDLQVNDEGNVVCSWLISRNATKRAGPLVFRLSFKCVSEDGEDYERNTDDYHGITIPAGTDSSGTIEEEYPDVISQMMGKINALSKGGLTGSGINKRMGYVTLLSTRWSRVDEDWYFQTVTVDVVSGDDVTENSQVNLNPSDAQMAIWREKDVAFTTRNYGGNVTVYAIGQKPENDYTIQVTIVEVEV